MTLRMRLQRLERSALFDRSCPACRERRCLFTLVIREQLADGTLAEPQGMPAPCMRCGQIPERIIEIVEEVVVSPAAVSDGAEDMQAGESLVDIIDGGPDQRLNQGPFPENLP
jgi:hypothetical protein